MDTKLPFIFFLITFSTSVLMMSESDSDVYNVKNNRKKRQNGYKYEKPTVPFDLPSSKNSITATTETQIVNQMQMYYAYPVSSAEKNDVGPANSNGNLHGGPIEATRTSGYNYEGQSQPQIEPVKNSATIEYSKSASQVGSEPGYSYEEPKSGNTNSNSATSTQENQNVIQTQGSGYTASNAISATRTGYNYEVQSSIGPGQMGGNTVHSSYVATERDYSTENQNTRGVISKAGTLGGYNYDVQNTPINQAVVNTENAPDTIDTGNTGGYYYDKQTIASNRMEGNIASFGISGIGPESFGGYNYNVQTDGIRKTNDNNIRIDHSSTKNTGEYDQGQTIDINKSDVDDSGYNYERQNNAVSQPVTKLEEISVSTRAPTYLPPFQAVAKTSNSYLPPKIKETIKTINSFTSAVTTKSPLLLKPLNYLTPGMVNHSLITGPKPTKVQTMQTADKYIPPNLPSRKLPSLSTSRKYITPNSDANQNAHASTNSEGSKRSNQRVQPIETNTNGHQYLPPTNSYTPTVSPPASTYLPPI